MKKKKYSESENVKNARKVRKDGKVYALRTCDKDMLAYGGFKWPKKGKVVAPDWSDESCCGKGLHGALWGRGDAGLLSWKKDAVAQVVRIDSFPIVDLGGKVKFESCTVVYTGSIKDAAEKIQSLGAKEKVIAGTATAGDDGTATAGYAGTATAGDRGTATAGNRGTATAGDDGTATAGYAGTATAGDDGTATAGKGGTATAGNRGTATAGNRGTATAGYAGTATAGYAGTATAGDDGTATAGDAGTATAGYAGVIVIKMWHTEKKKYVLRAAAVGENGKKPNTAYVLDRDGEFVEKK